MERIQGVLLKLQELYFDKHQKTSIDLDLMLDYTRVLYADLLDWRKNVPDAAGDTTATSLNEGTAVPAGLPQNKAVSIETATTPEHKEQNIVPENLKPTPVEKEEIGNVEESVSPSPEPPSGVATPAAPESEELPPVKEPERRETTAEDPENIGANDLPDEPEAGQRRGINFEPPGGASSEGESAAASDEGRQPPRDEGAAPSKEEVLEQKASLLPDYTAMLNKQQRLKKDIRAEIGINDRYLYLNELFGNKKSLYESVLGRLNDMASLSEARTFIKNEVAAAQKWDDEDETVQDFYGLLQKHFMGR